MPRPPRGLAGAAAFWVVLGVLWLITGLVDSRSIRAVRQRGLEPRLLQDASDRPLAPFLARHYDGLAVAEMLLGAAGVLAALRLVTEPTAVRARVLEWITWAAALASLVGVRYAEDVAWAGVMVQALAQGGAPPPELPAASVRAFNAVMLGLLAVTAAALRRAGPRLG